MWHVIKTHVTAYVLWRSRWTTFNVVHLQDLTLIDYRRRSRSFKSILSDTTAASNTPEQCYIINSCYNNVSIKNVKMLISGAWRVLCMRALQLQNIKLTHICLRFLCKTVTAFENVDIHLSR